MSGAETDSRRLDDYVAELRQWVSIETFSRDRDAVERLLRMVAQSCTDAGLAVEWAGGGDGACRTLLARGGPATAGPGILVLAHLDTVHPEGTLESALPWRIESDRLYGPGIYDMKGSALMALSAWRRLRETGQSPEVPVTFLFSPDEEIGSPSSRSVIESEARNALATLVVEPARDGGKIVTARKGVARFVITATGKPAHSGSNFELGRNAISEIARQIPALDALTDLDAGITVNVGTISGGTSPNTIAAHCLIEVDVRVQRLDHVEPTLAAIRSLRPRDPDVVLSIEGDLNRPPFDASEGSRALFRHARNLAAGLGIDLIGISAGGGSDGNFTAAMDVPTLDGLGVDGAGAHTLDEHIILSSVVPRIDLFAELLRTISAKSISIDEVAS
ncbi:M20 family metallopeptidase [Aquibium oceanicum]|uniref:Peptidase M20 dimerisation domain-containing protein n=1 Tax=Aquibium oceanicum TaxID=1670800 RepID=A0A1L3SR57_9HYPH|nr:M20 family metallopeptidase [Aquibium oceanicum]APH71888.1 hypothetical protein BSQ44_11305 [Aquibium oceanicum]